MSSHPNIPLIATSLAASWLISVAVHELGHAVAGRLAGLRVVACGIGFRPWPHVKLRGIYYYIGWPLSGGLTLCLADDVELPRRRLAAMIAGGPLANLLVFAGTAWLWQSGRLPGFAPELCLVSGWLASTGLLPFSFQRNAATFRTDALLFAQLCRGTNHQWSDSGVNLGTQLFLRDFFRRLNCLPGIVYATTGAALFYALLGDHEQASALLSDEALSDPRRDREGVALESLARVSLAFSTEAADFPEILAKSRQACVGKTAAMIAFDLIEAEWQHHHGLNAISTVTEAMRTARQAGLHALEAAAESLFLQIDPPANLADQCRSLLARRGARSLTEDGALELVAATARICAERGDARNAGEFFAKALAAVRRIASHIPSPTTRERFLKCQGAALRAAATAGDGVPAFLMEPVPERPRVLHARIGIAASAAGLLLAPFAFTQFLVAENHHVGATPASEASLFLALAILLIGLLGTMFSLLSRGRQSGSRRLGLYGLIGNLSLVLVSMVAIRELSERVSNEMVVGEMPDVAMDAASDVEDILNAAAMKNLRSVVQMQFAERRTNEAVGTCRRLMEIGRNARPPSPASARELFALAKLLRTQDEVEDAETACRLAIAALGGSNARVPAAYTALLNDVSSAAKSEHSRMPSSDP